MPKNLEVKVRIRSAEEAISSARAIGATFQCEMHQIDTYFQTHRGRLKLREIEHDHSELICYERDETSSHRLSDYKVYPVVDAGALKKILEQSIGVREVVRKMRTLFFYDSVRIHIDQVEGLGNFVELEAPVVEILSNTGEILNFLSEKFRFTPGEYILQSYVDLLLEKNESSALSHQPVSMNRQTK